MFFFDYNSIHFTLLWCVRVTGCFVQNGMGIKETACTAQATEVSKTLDCSDENKGDEYIEIKTIKVGYSQNAACDYDICSAETLNSLDSYALEVGRFCQYRVTCVISSIQLFRDFEFLACGRLGVAARNTVTIDYMCVDRGEDDQ